MMVVPLPLKLDASPHTNNIQQRRERIRNSFGTLLGCVLILSTFYFVSDSQLIQLNDFSTTTTTTRKVAAEEFTTILDALEIKEEHDKKYGGAATSTTVVECNPNTNCTGRIWYVGFEFVEVGRFVFPDYKKMDKNSSNWRIHGKPNDIIVVGMHGPGAQAYPKFHKTFPGKILVVNGEPHGRIPTKKPRPRTYQLSGPITEKMSYSKINNPKSKFVRNYHGLRIFLARFPEHHHKFFTTPTNSTTTTTTTTPPQRPRWNGTESRIIYSNSNCVQHRQDAAQHLSTILPVDAGGRCTVPNATKVDIPRDHGFHANWVTYGTYKYCISIENSHPPGYVSEKIILAYMGGCLPIYYGTKEIYNIFHPRSFLFYDPQNPEVLLNEIKYLESNRSAYDEMLSYPILKNGSDTVNKYFSISDEFGDGSIKRQIRDMMDIHT